MKLIYILSLLFLVACAKKADDSASNSCPNYSNSLVVSSQTFSCTNTVDGLSTYKVIAIVGGDTSISNTAAYKADLKSKFALAKTRATRVLYFSSPNGTASSAQLIAAQEAVIEDSVTILDLYSMSIGQPHTYTGFVATSISGYLAL